MSLLIAFLARARGSASSVGLTYQGSFTPYITMTVTEAIAEVSAGRGETVNHNGTTVHYVDVPSGTYSVGADTDTVGREIISVNRSTWVVLRASAPGQVVVDAMINNRGYEIRNAVSEDSKLVLCGVTSLGGALGQLRSSRLVGMWFCDMQHTTLDQLDHYYAGALTTTWWDGIKNETPIHKDFDHPISALYNYAYLFDYDDTAGSGAVDYAACQAKLNASAVDYVANKRGWMDDVLRDRGGGEMVSKKWRDLVDIVPVWTPSGVRIDSYTGGSAAFDARFWYTDIFGCDDGVYAGSVINTVFRGCRIGTLTEWHDTPGKAHFSIDPGAATGDEADSFHNDGMQLSSSGYKFWLFDLDIYGRLIHNQETHQSYPSGISDPDDRRWNLRGDSLTFIAMPHHHEGGFWQWTSLEQAAASWPSGADDAFEPLFLFALNQAQDPATMDMRFNSVEAIAPTTFTASDVVTRGGTSPGTNWSTSKIDNVAFGTTDSAATALITLRQGGFSDADFLDHRIMAKLDSGTSATTARGLVAYEDLWDLTKPDQAYVFGPLHGGFPSWPVV